ncbi:hypothetical protein BGZ94_004576 [Podila epigama]|nr:hypothetical protein BGZ94_004576 [Podila epigama]
MGATHQSVASRLMGSLQMLVFFMLPIIAFAQQQNPNNGRQPDVLNDLLGDGRSISLTWQRIVGGLVLMFIGVVLTFRGYRHYRCTMFLAGFIAGCVIIYSILTNVEPREGWDKRQIIYVFSCLGGGLLFGAICWLFHRFTVWVLGALAGLMVALYVLAWRSEGLIRNKGGRIGLLVGASVLGLLVALVMGRRILIPATALVGSYLSVIGLDLFARTGFSESIKRFFTSNDRVDYRLTTNIYIMLGVIGGLILLGLLFQTLSWNRRQKLLIAQGRPLHNHDHDWTCFRSNKTTTVRPDPTYSQGYSNSTNSYDHNTGYGYNNNNNNNNTTTAHSEKKNWNPFNKNKEKTTTTTTVHTDYPDTRVSYSSNTALNQ